ncbi:MAG: hypothetical protein ACXWUG_13875 [Polyangiales bacterium]
MKTSCFVVFLLASCASNPPPKTEATEASATAPAPADPGTVCDHTRQVLDAEMPTAKTKKEQDEARKECVDRGTAMRKDAPARWSCESSCTLAATTFADLRTCDEKCSPK